MICCEVRDIRRAVCYQRRISRAWINLAVNEEDLGIWFHYLIHF